jgi:membrane associated rhomboid family serine protease
MIIGRTSRSGFQTIRAFTTSLLVCIFQPFKDIEIAKCYAQSKSQSFSCGASHLHRNFSSTRIFAGRQLRSPKTEGTTPNKKIHQAPLLEPLDPLEPPECEEEPEPESDPERKMSERVVLVIIAPCAALFAYKYMNEAGIDMKGSANAPLAVKKIKQYNKTFVFSERNVAEGRWWTGITATFAHGSVAHLILNMSTLWSLGPPLVRALGPAKFGFLYFGAGIAGSLTQYWWWKRTVPKYGEARGAVGASGSLLGLVGAMTYIMPRSQVSFFFIPMTMWQATAGVGALSVASMYNDWLPGLGHAAHLGGLLFGGICAVRLFGTGRFLRTRLPYRR